MTNRDSIIRKINALKANAENHANAPHLVEQFARKYQELMEEYNLTISDLEVKNSDVHSGIRREKGQNNVKNLHPMAYVTVNIATLTDTIVYATQKDLNKAVFFGLQADIDYALWLYDLIANGMKQGYLAFKISADYHRALNSGLKPSQIEHSFKHGFKAAINKSLYQMIQEKKTKGNALILVKQEIILAALNQNEYSTSKEIIIKTKHQEVVQAGYSEGQKVKLRQEVANPIQGYLE